VRKLVTGGAGFIGSHLVEALAARGERVRVLDNFSTGRAENLERAREQVDVLEGDVRDVAALEAAMRGVEYVWHLAALVSVPDSIRDPRRYHEVNVDGTLSILVAARKAGVRRVVFASSTAVYGLPTRLPTAEDHVTAPSSPYGLSKLVGEGYCQLFTRVYGLPTISLRYFNVFGPRQRANSDYAGVIAKFVSRLVAGEPVVIYGDGHQSRDFIYVADIVRANLAACEAKDACGQVVNVGTGQGCKIRDLAATLGELIGVRSQPTFAPERPGDVAHSLAATARAEEVLGFRARTSLADGLAATVAWYRERNPL